MVTLMVHLLSQIQKREKEVYYSKEGVILGQTMFFYKNDLDFSWQVKKQNSE